MLVSVAIVGVNIVILKANFFQNKLVYAIYKHFILPHTYFK